MMVRNSSNSTRVLTAWMLFVVSVLAGGCDDTFIDPFRNEGRIYTIYGYLDQLDFDHAVRVIPVTRNPERIENLTDRQAEIDARVFSTDLETGQRIQWTHRLEKLASGKYAHIFRASFRAVAGRRYRLEVVRSDGATASAETGLPYIGDASDFEQGPLNVSADSSLVTQDISVPVAQNLYDIRSTYLLEGAGAKTRVYVSYGRSGEPTVAGGWEFTLDYRSDMFVVQDSLQRMIGAGLLPDEAFGITDVGIRIRLLDERWALPTGDFDPEVLAQPGTMSNVENGYGYWGAVATFWQEWAVTSEFSQLLGNPF